MDQEETAAIAYGAMLEANHLAGYAFQRTMERLSYLTTGRRYQELGFASLNAMIRTLDLSPFNLRDTRPELIQLLHEADVSNRAIADALGVSRITVSRDLTTGTNVPPDPPLDGRDAEETGTNVPPEADPPSLALPFNDEDDDEDAWVEQVERDDPNGEGQENWPEDQRERRRFVTELGYPTLANHSTDAQLIKWAKFAGCHVYIGRGSPWGNPFEIPKDGNREYVIESFAQHYLPRKASLLEALASLKGKVLECYCYPEPCHGEVLIESISREAWDMLDQLRADDAATIDPGEDRYASR